MSLDLTLIEKLMRMLEQSDLQELNVSQGGMQLRLAKRRIAALETSSGNSAVLPADHEATASEPASTTRQILSGMAGTFYRAPKPGAPPFVSEGSAFREGDQLAIVEAMKMLNPIEADCDGKVIRILLPDGASVEQGTALFEIEAS